MVELKLIVGPAGTFCAGLGTAAGVSALFGVNLPVGSLPLIGGKEEEEADEHHYVNWSNTHEAFPRYVFQPQTEDELQLIIYKAHRKGMASCYPVRLNGYCLS